MFTARRDYGKAGIGCSAVRESDIVARAYGTLYSQRPAGGVAEFCISESVSEASFYRWRKLLSVVVEAPPTTARFIDAGALAPAVAPAVSAHQGTPELEVRLELGHGLVLHIVRR